jgi:hypothetical protein
MTNKILMDFLHSPYYFFLLLNSEYQNAFPTYKVTQFGGRYTTIEVLFNNKWKRQYENALPKNNLLDIYFQR